jgi:hypothetical protein
VIVWILPSSITADTTDVVFAAPVVSLKKTTWPQGTPAYGSVAEDGYFAGRLGRRHHHAVSAREAARVEGMPGKQPRSGASKPRQPARPPGQIEHGL